MDLYKIDCTTAHSLNVGKPDSRNVRLCCGHVQTRSYGEQFSEREFEKLCQVDDDSSDSDDDDGDGDADADVEPKPPPPPKKPEEVRGRGRPRKVKPESNI